MKRKRRIALMAFATIIAVIAVEVSNPKPLLIWNRTASAPIGLYWRLERPPLLNGWVLASPESDAANWIAAHGFLARDWPVIKRVRAVSADLVCRVDNDISINGIFVAHAFLRANSSIDLPKWSGCYVLGDDEFFLLNDHPRSLDGRYFGVTKRQEIEGGLMVLWEAPSWLE